MVAIVLLDSNMLFVPMQFKVDIYEAIPRLLEQSTELVLLSGVKEEIVQKNKRSIGKLVSKQGLGVLQLVSLKVEQGNVSLMKVDRRPKELVDDYIIRAARQIKEAQMLDRGKPVSRIIVATNDKGLKKKSKADGFEVLQLRQKRYLELF
jgi:rRNA-processing protein FCF1